MARIQEVQAIHHTNERKKMKIIDSFWLTGLGCVGIVKCETDRGEIKYYIGSTVGIDQNKDEKMIAALGNRLPNPVGKILFGDE